MTSEESNKFILGGAVKMASQPVRQKASSDDMLMRAVLVAVALWLVGTVLLPLGALLIKSVEGPKGEFVGLANFVQYFSNPALTASITNSLWIAFVSTAIC